MKSSSRAAAARRNLAPGPLMIDIAGTQIAPAEALQLGDPRVGGVILFSRNFKSLPQLKRLTAALHAVREQPLLVAVDHEGGRVQRFTRGFTRLPAMRTLGRIHSRDPIAGLHAATLTGYVLAAELRAAGVDLSFTPVLDLDYGESAVIGDRAFDRNPAVVAALAGALIGGLHGAGMAACGKHFPGHGYVTADSHVAVPRDRRTLAAIMRDDVAPYRALPWPLLDAIMPAHVVYPKVDARQPAGFSRRWITSILRGRLGFDGVVFSDDLAMEGASVAGDVEARARAAMRAGCDMVLVCNAPALAAQVLAMRDLVPNAASGRRLARLVPTQAAPEPTSILRARRALARALE